MTDEQPKTAWTYETLREGTATASATSTWFRIDQSRIDGFAEVTADPDPMHIDPKWCAEFSPFETTIAFGFLTMSLLTALLREALGTSADPGAPTTTYPLNYGFDRLRLISPVPVGSRIRGHFRLLGTNERKPGQLLVKVRAEIEIENHDKPALIGDWLTVFVQADGGEAARDKTVGPRTI